MVEGFKPLTIEEKGIFDQHIMELEGDLSSFSYFPSLMAWNFSTVCYYKLIRDYLCIVLDDKPFNRIVCLPPLGKYIKETFEETIKTLYKLFKEKGIELVFLDVQEWMLPYYKALQAFDISYEYDRDFSDYVYTLEDHRGILNKKKMRNAYHHFLHTYHPECVPITNENKIFCYEFLNKRWCNEHTCKECLYGCLLIATKRYVEIFEELGLMGFIIKVQEEMVGYAVVGIEKDVLAFHFTKTLHTLRGINEYSHIMVNTLYGDHLKAINCAEDMGKEGIRKYKERLAPYFLQHKYTVRLTERMD